MADELPAGLNPYVGPRTFTRADRSRFFGREREARELLSLVISQRLVLFYAQSGAGKSSLINTRLAPQLAEEGFAVLPVARVGGELPPGVSAVDNVFLFNLMLSLDHTEGAQSGGGRDPNRLAHVSLGDFLARLTSEDGERFTYDETLQAGAASTAADAPAASLPAVGEAYAEPNYVLIIDQFEEIFTSHPGRWEDRGAFFAQLDATMRADRRLWVVLTLREDYVAALDPYAPLLTDKLRARYYMQRMGIEAALEAITRPAGLGGRPFADGVAEQLVDNLRQVRVPGQQATIPGQYVEPVQLQVVCYQLWENIKDRPPGPIAATDLQEAGDVDRALTQFYEETLAAALADPAAAQGERAAVAHLVRRGVDHRGRHARAGAPGRGRDRRPAQCRGACLAAALPGARRGPGRGYLDRAGARPVCGADPRQQRGLVPAAPRARCNARRRCGMNRAAPRACCCAMQRWRRPRRGRPAIRRRWAPANSNSWPPAARPRTRSNASGARAGASASWRWWRGS